MTVKQLETHPRTKRGIPVAGFRGKGLGPEFRALDESKRTAEVTVCRYNVVDDYGTIWEPGCFREGLQEKLPKVVWSHDWSDVIGQVIAFDDNDERLKLTLQFSNFDAVPRAKQAWTQMRDGDVDEMSFGFDRLEYTIVDDPDAPEGARERMIKATMWEASPVLVGAVPGTAVHGVRTIDAQGTVDVQSVAQIAVRLGAGEIDLGEALTEIKSLAQPIPPNESETSSEGSQVDAEPAEQPDATDDTAGGEVDVSGVLNEAIDAELVAAQAVSGT